MSDISSTTAPVHTPLPTQVDLDRIKANLIEHNQHVLCEKAFQNVDYEPGLMSAVVGPTGVGKTTLLSTLDAKLNGKFRSANPGDVPVVSTYMEASEEGVFNWKNFYRHGLLPHLNAPLD
jgi:ABC-type nitrate/sulfonate/bicarbonate transport system ATPase subunit